MPNIYWYTVKVFKRMTTTGYSKPELFHVKNDFLIGCYSLPTMKRSFM